MERIIDRFDKYMKVSGLNDNKVTTDLDLSVGTIGKSRRNQRDLSRKVVIKILDFYSNIEESWLKTGKGDMLKPDPEYQLLKSELLHASEVKVIMCEDCRKLKIELLECHRKKDALQDELDKYRHERDNYKNDLDKILFENPKIPRPHHAPLSDSA